MNILNASMFSDIKCSRFCDFINKNKYFMFVIFSLFLLSISFLRDVIYPEIIGLDPSWMWAMNNIFKFVPGQDWAFTYGPWGFMFVPQMYGHNIIEAIVFNNIVPVYLFCLGCGYLIYLQYKQQGENAIIRACILMICWWLFFPMAYHWELVIFILSVCLMSSIDKIHIFRLISAVLGGLLAFILLLKFNVFVCSALICFVLAFVLLFQNKRAFVNYILSSGIAFGVGIGLDIIYVFENVANFVDWLAACLDISSFFSQAMVLEGNAFPFLYVAVSAFLLYLVIIDVCFFQNRKIFYILLVGLPVAFFSFKHGFVRQDAFHMITFFTLFFYLASLVWFLGYNDDNNKLFVWGLAVSQILFVICIYIFSPLQLNIGKFWSLKKQAELFEKYDVIKQSQYNLKKLPESWLNIIGEKSVEALPYELSYIPANKLNWVVNPIVQLYSAYSRRLDEKSAASFIKKRAPEFIITEFTAIDWRNMVLDTPATWNVIKQNYEIVKNDNHKALLKRRNVVRNEKFVPLKWGNARLNQKINLASIKDKNNFLYASFDIKPTWWGRIRTFFYRATPVWMIVFRADNSIKKYKLAPDSLKNPFLISMIPDNIYEFYDFLKGQEKELVREFLIFADENNWQKEVQIRLYKRECDYEK